MRDRNQARASRLEVAAGTKKLKIHEAQHETGKFLCRACFLPFAQARHAHAHKREDYKSEKFDAYRHDKKRTLQCPESRCGKVFDGKAILNKHNKGTHGTGSKECEICGMKYHRGYVHPGLTTGDDDTCPGYVVVKKGDSSKQVGGSVATAASRKLSGVGLGLIGELQNHHSLWSRWSCSIALCISIGSSNNGRCGMRVDVTKLRTWGGR
mgnify:FL=1